MERKTNPSEEILKLLRVQSFEQRFPWIGGDLQTLRDTLRKESFPPENARRIEIPIPALPNGSYKSGRLLALLEEPESSKDLLGLVLILHGLGGSSSRQGLRRLSLTLKDAGFAILRVNLRGAIPGRKLAGGTYAANSNTDLWPVIFKARQLANSLLFTRNNSNPKIKIPLFGIGISLGGTILLNACLQNHQTDKSNLDGLVCTSSPLDLTTCSESIERPRNKIYQTWLVNRLIHQTLNDPFGITDLEKEFLQNNSKEMTNSISIRDFDSYITAPRWGYKTVDDYYIEASPLPRLLLNPTQLPKTLFIHAEDDPWVPYNSTKELFNEIYSKQSKIEFIFTKHGGHNGFHGIKNCWCDLVVRKWLMRNL